ncbi:hypothetical protein NPIL_160351 [Nephila pilipes]|uniref:Uncharacterized protein n=1 Tax=Nephila pilipes TaxID=299642 RepID=A0A8X6QUX9_NEPPI|nr:hypothetical protein NPIL_160351 [Nephila pilipes]
MADSHNSLVSNPLLRCSLTSKREIVAVFGIKHYVGVSIGDVTGSRGQDRRGWTQIRPAAASYYKSARNLLLLSASGSHVTQQEHS